MKIVFVIEHAYPHIGGGETFFYGLARNLVKKNHEVTVLSSSSGGKIGKQTIEGVQYVYFPWLSLFNHAIPKTSDIEPFVEKADIVHTATYTAAPGALRLAKKYNKPCLLTVYENLGNKWFMVTNFFQAVLFYLFEYFVLHRNYTFYHAISEATKKDLINSGIETKKIKRIYCGIDEGHFNTTQNTYNLESQGGDLKTFLYFGRDGKTKGLNILKKAIQILKNELPANVQFKFLEPVNQTKLIKEIQESYCVIVPSITEGFGFAAAESCSLGKPVIVSSAGSLPEVVSGKVLFFENRDAFDLSKKIKLAIENKFQEIPKKSFKWEKTTDEMEKLYKKLI